MLARCSQCCCCPIGAGLSLAELVWFETIGAGPSLAASFRIGLCRPVVGRVDMTNCFPARC